MVLWWMYYIIYPGDERTALKFGTWTWASFIAITGLDGNKLISVMAYITPINQHARTIQMNTGFVVSQTSHQLLS